MKSRSGFTVVFTTLIVAMFVFSGCDGGKKERMRHDSLPDEVKVVALAIMNESADTFASNVNYPLSRPYPLKDIRDSAEMVRYYPTMVDDSLKRIISETPDTLWQECGWRGWTNVDKSYIWIDEGKVYEVDYLSNREKSLLDSLRKEEISSLDASLRGGWVPVFCMVDTVDGNIFRIDSDSLPDYTSYRLAGYRVDSNLSAPPSIVLYGTLNTEGSMGIRYYHFTDSVGNGAEYMPDVCGEDSLPSIELYHNGKQKKIYVSPAYWLDHVKK